MSRPASPPPARVVGGEEGLVAADLGPLPVRLPPAERLAGAVRLRPQVARALEEDAGRDVPLALGVDQEARPVPVRDRVADQPLQPRSPRVRVERDRPRRQQHRLERHPPAGPFRVLQVAGDRRVVVEPGDAAAVLQRQPGVAVGVVVLEVEQVALGHEPVEVGALGGADPLAAQLAPLADARGGRRHHVHARGVVVRLDDGHDLPALLGVAERRDHDVDRAVLEALEPVGRGDADQRQRHVQAPGEVGREIGLEADELPRRIDGAEQRIVVLHPHHEGAAPLDVVDRVHLRRRRDGPRRQQGGDQERQPGEEAPTPSGRPGPDRAARGIVGAAGGEGPEQTGTGLRHRRVPR
jgi:hypothetical protein